MPQTAQRAGDLAGHVARLRQRGRAHRLRLPGFDIVAVDLDMADRLAEMRAVRRAHRELGDLEIETDLAFHDDARFLHPPGGQRLVPGLATSSADFSRDWPLPEDDITGLTKQGKPIRAAAACNSSSDEQKA